uniref:Uncharacterized protein n=1 Tax=Parascaris equorum TaxID=6256 RepID=A0A914R441_PAREQ
MSIFINEASARLFSNRNSFSYSIHPERLLYIWHWLIARIQKNTIKRLLNCLMVVQMLTSKMQMDVTVFI